MDHGPPDPPVRRPLRSKARQEATLHDVLAPKRLLNWKLDWREYFRRFCELHGGNPVEVGGRLMLPDGWAYSATSYRGPEWPPPDDPAQRRELMRRYWAERNGIVRDELKLLRSTRASMVQQLVNRSAPLIIRTRTWDEAANKMKVGHDELTLDAVDERISWLEETLAFGCERLAELKGIGNGQELDQEAPAVAGTAVEQQQGRLRQGGQLGAG